MKSKHKQSFGLLYRDDNTKKILNYYRFIFSVLIFGWTLIILFFLIWKLNDLQKEKTTFALTESKSFVLRDINNKTWDLFHRLLAHTEKESTKKDLSGIVDTAIFLHKKQPIIISSDKNIITRIVSLNPIKETNLPDKFENKAYNEFKAGKIDFFSYDTLNNHEYFRYARPLIIKKECLTCHSNENKEGEIKGIYSVAISSLDYNNYYRRQAKNNIIVHTFIWISGLLIILFSFRKIYLHTKELKLSREQFYEFLDNAPMSTFIKDAEGNLIYMNKIAEQYLPLNFRNGEWKGLKDSDIWDKEIVEKLRKNDLEILSSMKSKVFEETIETEGKKYVWLTHKFPIKDNSNGKTYIVGIEIDITDRKQKEEEIKKYTKQLEDLNKSKDKFISILAHDLRGPFTPILGYTELLATSAEYLTYQEIKEYAHSLDVIVKNQFQLLENILDWSRLESGRIKIEPKELNLFDEVKKVINLYQPIINDKEIKIIEKVDPSFEIITDQHSLNTILRNLISNAIKYTPRKGIIQIIATKENDGYKIQVIDNGIGIPEENLSKIFGGEKGFTTRGTANEKGTGLGLSICKELIEKLGGKIWVESEPGKGSTFSFTLHNIKTN